MAEHLQQHAGEPDILDSLVRAFSGSLKQGGASADIRERLSAPPDMAAKRKGGDKTRRVRALGATKSPVGTMGPAHYRSRIDEYFHMQA